MFKFERTYFKICIPELNGQFRRVHLVQPLQLSFTNNTLSY